MLSRKWSANRRRSEGLLDRCIRQSLRKLDDHEFRLVLIGVRPLFNEAGDIAVGGEPLTDIVFACILTRLREAGSGKIIPLYVEGALLSGAYRYTEGYDHEKRTGLKAFESAQTKAAKAGRCPRRAQQ